MILFIPVLLLAVLGLHYCAGFSSWGGWEPLSRDGAGSSLRWPLWLWSSGCGPVGSGVASPGSGVWAWGLWCLLAVERGLGGRISWLWSLGSGIESPGSGVWARGLWHLPALKCGLRGCVSRLWSVGSGVVVSPSSGAWAQGSRLPALVSRI